MTHLDTLFPDWQPAGEHPSLMEGARQLSALLSPEILLEEVAIERDPGLPVEAQIRGRSPIVRQLQAFRARLESATPETLFTVGGTCGMEVVPVTYLNRRYGGELTLFWFDAHGDLNTPESSPSKNFHGMPLRSILGDGDPEILSLQFDPLTPDQVVLAGVRDLDPAEANFIRDTGMSSVSAATLSTPGAFPAFLADSAIPSRGRHAYVHVDFDVCDPGAWEHVFIPVNGGIDMPSLVSAVAAIAEQYTIVGSSMVEFAPHGSVDAAALRELSRLLRPVG